MRKKPEIPFSHKFPNVDPLALHLLECLLSFDPKDRPSAKDALADPYFQGLVNVEREPSTRAISKLEFEFERKKLAKDDVREILEYHPQILQEYLRGGEQTSFMYPSGVDRFKQQFAHLMDKSSSDGRSSTPPLQRQHASLPRERVPTPKVETFTLQGNNTEKTTKTLAVTTHDSPRRQNQGSENAAEPTSAHPDISIRRHSLDLLYGMCDVSNTKDIVEELLQYLATADFEMRKELALKAAILAEKFAPDLSWYVDFVTNNEDLQPYVALKAREYLDKPAIHETMVKVSAYLLGEYSHLLARRPGFYSKYESCIDAEIKQRAVEYFALSRKGAVLMDILAEMPKFSERQSSLIKKSEDTDVDTIELSAIKLRAHLQTSNALANGANVIDAPPTADMLRNLLSLLAIKGSPAVSTQLDHNGIHGHEDSGVLYEDLYVQICIKAEWRDHEGHFVLFLGNKNTAPLDLVQAVILPPSHLKLELSLLQEVIPPRAQVQCPLEVVNLRPSRDVAVLEFFYKLDATNARDE
ncbi:AP-2 complex subunit alpha-1-like protein isoform X2 [Tanacetum coccineum]